MIHDTLEQIAGRALLDRAFLEALLARPEEALAPYGLSPADRAQVAAAVRGVEPAAARQLAAAFEAHVAGRKAHL